MSEPEKVCERCGATEPEVGYRVQPFIILGSLHTIRGTFCRNCAEGFAETDNWVIRGSKMTFSPTVETANE